MDAELDDTTPSHHLLHNELRVIRQAGRQAVAQFLQSYNCHSILKTSTKVVVFDLRIPIQLAFYALVEHGTVSSVLFPIYFGFSL
jgi:5'-AMP-activated protein kinase regulatory gamma subunit